MGTRFELALLADGGESDQAGARAAGEAALDEIEQWHRRLNRFAPDSLVAHLGRTAAATPVRLDRETYDLFTDALDVWRASHGAFDVTTPRVERSSEADDRPTSAACLELDSASRTVRFSAAPVSLDFGGIAKGHALDCAGAVLREAGIRNAILHGGTSSVLALGRPPDASGWRVALGSGPDAEVLTLSDLALSVSDADSQAALTGARHIADPREAGRTPAVSRVAVTGPSARLADAWSTALVVLGQVPTAFPKGYTARFLRSAC